MIVTNVKVLEKRHIIATLHMENGSTALLSELPMVIEDKIFKSI